MSKVRVKIGMRVDGECASGTVIAMTSEWCIYRMDKPAPNGACECAEPWSGIMLAVEYPKRGEEVSSRTSNEIEQ